MRKILVIDDEVLRREMLKKVLEWESGGLNNNDEIKNDITFAPTYEEGLRLITKFKYDFIFLDHDLGSVEIRNNGYELAKVIPNSINKDATIIVISLNPVGVANILSVLPNSIQCPVYLVPTQWHRIRDYNGK